MTESEPNDRNYLERFVVNNPELERLEDLLGEFNLFEALDLSENELRHSRFISWLCNPKETHPLGDYFLKRFLLMTLSRGTAFSPKPIDVALWDLSDTIVACEKNKIDILILNEDRKFVCAIENKVYSKEHDNQLSRYREFLNQTYPSFSRHFVLLSPDGSKAEDDAEAEYWIPISYGTVCEVVDHVIEAKASILSQEVRTFIQHYAAMLRRRVLENSEIQQLAHQIYQKHSKAIDLIYENKPDIVSRVRQVVEEVIRSERNLYLSHSSKSYISFYPQEWDSFQALQKVELYFEFYNTSDSLRLTLYLGPGEEIIRNAIFRFAGEHRKVFTNVGKSLNSKWNQLFKKLS